MTPRKPCAGCGEQPKLIWNWGRYKFVCPRYHGHLNTTTDRCDRSSLARYSRSETEAGLYWDDRQQERKGPKNERETRTM